MSADGQTTWTALLVLRVVAFVIVAVGGCFAVMYAIDGWAGVAFYAGAMTLAFAFLGMLVYGYRHEQD